MRTKGDALERNKNRKKIKKEIKIIKKELREMLELKNTMNDVNIVITSNNTCAEEGICEYNVKSIA